jgi:hypothetical protein
MPTALVGLMCIYFIGPTVLDLMKSKTKLPEAMLLAIILISMMLEFMITQFSQLLMARGDMRVTYYSLLGAILICISEVVLFTQEYNLMEVFLARMFVYIAFIGVPVFIMTRAQLFTVQQDSI